MNMLKPDVISWIERSLGHGSRVNSAAAAKGATSSSVYFISSTVNGCPHKSVLRLFSKKDWLENEPDLAEHEAAVLKLAWDAGLPVPKLINHAPDDKEMGIPAVLMTFIDGKIELQPESMDYWLRQQAENLVDFHKVNADQLKWKYFSWTEIKDFKPPEWSEYPDLWEEAYKLWTSGPPECEHVFIHRDYHPVNVLWRDNKICGIIDLVNSCRGPAGVDLAHCRGNLLLMYGPDTADDFLKEYVKAAAPGFRYQPYWDIDRIFGLLPEPEFYHPWKEYGFGYIDQSTLCRRTDQFLKRIVDNI